MIVEGAVNGAPRKFTYEVKFSGENSENEFIPRLWATRRVGYLLDEIRLRGENTELRDEVTELARKYSIVTPYTAYLIMEDEGRRNVSMSSRSFQKFDSDVTARKEAAQNWNSFKLENSGEKALADARYGYAKTSVSDLARAIGFSKAYIYRFFESKQAIGEAICGDCSDTLYNRVREAVELTVGLREHCEHLTIEPLNRYLFPKCDQFSK